LTGVLFAVVDVELAVVPLVAAGAEALVGTNQVLAGGTILARVRRTLIDLVLAVAAVVALRAVALVAVAGIPATPSILAKLVSPDISLPGCNLAGDGLDVTNLACPANLWPML